MDDFLISVGIDACAILKSEVHSAFIESDFVLSGPNSEVFYTLAHPFLAIVEYPQLAIKVQFETNGNLLITSCHLIQEQPKLRSVTVDWKCVFAAATRSRDALAFRRTIKEELCHPLYEEIKVLTGRYPSYNFLFNDVADPLTATNLKEGARQWFDSGEFMQAASLYSKAIELTPHSAEVFAERALAYIKLGRLGEAIGDANKAIEFDHLMVKGYLYKGMAYMELGEYRTAKEALEARPPLALEEDFQSTFTMLIKDCDDKIAAETGHLLKEA